MLKALVSVGLSVSAPALRLVPQLLVNDEPPQQADAIVVLGGDLGGSRLKRAVELFRAGYAPLLVVSGGPIHRDVDLSTRYMLVAKSKIQYALGSETATLASEATWAGLMREQAIELGVPPEKVLTQDRSMTTAEDASYTTQVLRDRRVGRAIVVTSSWHSARAICLFRAETTEIAWVSCPCAREWSGDWWDNNALTRTFASEFLKFAWPE